MRATICSVLRWLLRVAFFAAVVASLTAGGTGLDPDQKWGPFRQALLAVGVIGLGFPVASRLTRALDIRLTRQTLPLPKPPPASVTQGYVYGDAFRQPANSASSAAPLTHIPGPRSRITPLGGSWTRALAVRPADLKYLYLIPPLLIAVWILYVWFVSMGQMTSWTRTTSYYSLLAEAFLDGRTELRVDPPAGFAEVKDPYRHVKLGLMLAYVVDFSYFKEHFYLYYGPVPAVLIAPVMSVTGHAIGDQYITFAGVAGISLFAALILLHLHRAFFSSLPAWMLALGIIVAGTAHPMLWALSWAAIYSAAISCGQAFLLGGLFFSLPAIAGSETRKWRFAVAGLLWALALGSRINLAGGVAVLTLASIWGILRRYRPLARAAVERAALLLLPLGMAGVLLGYYNYVRFGSVLETGIRYSLNLRDQYYLMENGQFLNLAYFAPNVLYYLATPASKTPVFPFIRPVRESPASFSLFLDRLDVPDSHVVEGITGLVVAAPFILFAGILIAHLVCHTEDRPDEQDKSLRRIDMTILLAGLLVGMPLLLYFLVNSRYLMDFSPMLIILSVVGSWVLFRESIPYPIQRSLVKILVVSAAAMTLIIGFLLAVTGPAILFDDYNPGLWQWLRRLGSW